MEISNLEGTGPINPEIYPPLIKRIQSVIIDQVFIIVCMVVFSQMFTGYEETESRGGLLFGLFFIYEPVSIALGCSIGNCIAGIRVRRFGKEEKRINILQSYIRFITKLFLGMISFFTVTSNSYKQAIHDMAAGSLVIWASDKKN